MPTPTDRRRRVVALALFALAAAVFAPAVRGDFVLLDDLTYVVDNPHLREGLGAAGLRWALTTGYAANWHPLTWVTHLAAFDLFGLDPRGHHLVNVLLHAANAALLFALLRSLTGRLWPSALAAALFAVHPLRAEAVAWVSARKDVLSGLCWLLALGAWTRHARSPSASRYLAALALFALGLAAKPVVVTLPLALLILDAWPLGRHRAVSWTRLALEKVPFLVLAAASALVTWRVQAAAGALDPLAGLSLADRAANALAGYAVYLRHAFWPEGLAVLYPHAGAAADLRGPLAGLVLLLAVTALAFRWRRRWPWLAAGWSWYLVVLLPMIGIVQVGVQASADRYTYLPLIGIGLVVSWGAAGVAARSARVRSAVVAVALAAVAALSCAARVQTATWRDDVALFGRAVAVTRGNWLAHLNLGAALGARGEHERALEQFRAALRIRPDYPMARENERRALEALGR